MKQENNCYLSEKFNCKPPLLFVLPLNNHSDEMERQRDKEWFLKMQQLEKKSQQLREKMELLSKKYFFQLQVIQGMISNTNDINYRCIQRRNEVKLNIPK
jgi:hypothetical protein